MNTRRGKPAERDRGLLAHVRRAEARKVPLVQYCRANGLNVQSVYNLRSRLARSEGRLRPAAAKKRRPANSFVAVRVASPAASAAAACRLQVKGWVIECAGLPSSAWLAGLMAGGTDAVP